MFTGLIEETGTIEKLAPADDALVLTIACSRTLEGIRLGDSIAINGVCLTVTRADASAFDVLAGAETLRKSNLGSIRAGFPVNLERSLTLQTRLGGHLVQGHVETTGKIDMFIPEGETTLCRFTVAPETAARLVPKGSIAVNGVSLTIASVGNDWFTVSLIPATLAGTTFSSIRPGDEVNIETDIIGRYVERLLAPYREKLETAGRE